MSRSHKSFEKLEVRQLLASFAFNTAGIEAPVDRDLDGFNRSVEVWFNVSATGTGSGNFYVDVFEDDGPIGSDWLVRTSTNPLASGENLDVGVAIPTDLLGLPGDEVDQVIEFRLNLVNADTNEIVQTWTVASAAGLGNVSIETAAQDAIGGEIPPVLSSLQVGSPVALSVITPGDVVTLSVHVTDDVSPEFVLFWIDKDGNGVPNPETDSIGAGGSFLGTLFSGTMQNGTWTTSVTVDSSWGSGTIHVGAIAADVDGDYSTTLIASVRMNVVPAIATVTPSAALVTFGSTVTITANASDTDGSVNLVTFYVDVDQSGGWTGGTDIDLGVDSSSSGGWTRTVTVLTAWGTGTRRILAAARDNDGAWSAPQGTTVRFNAAPQVTSLVMTVGGNNASVMTHGDAVLLTAVASDSGGSVARVSFFLDYDADGEWSEGTDIAVGLDVDGSNGWTASFVPQSDWIPSATSRIVANAIDNDDVWSSVHGNIAARVNDRPVVTGLTVPTLAAAGQTLRLTAAATDSNIRAVSFFLDVGLDGRFTPGVDTDLGADFVSGDGWTKDVTVLSAWAGTVQFGANAVDIENVWGNVPRGSGNVTISAGPLVATLSNSASGTIGAGESFTLTGSVSAGVSARAMTFFVDVDGNSAWTPGVDIDLGADNDGSNGWSRTATVQSSWGDLTNVRFVANAVNLANQWGSRPTASASIIVWAGPRVTSVTVTGNPVDGVVTHDRTFTLTAILPASSGVQAVTFYYDANNNQRWDSGVDTDLGADFNGTNGWSITPRALSAWGTPAAARFAATAVSTTGAWGRSGTSSAPIRVNDRAVLSGFVPSSGTVAQNASVTLTLNAADAWGVSAVTMFADVDGNGFWSQGVDIDLGTALRTGGTAIDGVWALTVTANWALGTMRIVADARDSDGAWSGRRATTSVIVV